MSSYSAGRLALQVARDSNGSQMGSAAFGYDNADNAISEASSGYYGNYSKTFSYDNRGLLTGETRTNWNPTVNTYSYPCQGAKVKRFFSGVSGVEGVVVQESSPRFWVELSILLSCGR